MDNAGENREKPLSRRELFAQFRRPADDYGPIDCWWWEAEPLSKDRIRWQLEELARQGVAGTWFYPRFVRGEPLESDPPYWRSDEWWEFTRFALEEHRRLGLRAWVSDWTAHGFFQDQLREERTQDPALRGHRLVFRAQQASAAESLRLEISSDEEILDAAAYRNEGAGLEYGSRVDLGGSVAGHAVAWDAPGPDWQLTVVTSQAHDLDYLNKAAVERWLDLFLGTYKERVGDFVGQELEAFGPDEMFVLNGNILYAPALRDRFREEKGYDPLPLLVGLFADIGAHTDKIRCQYYDVMVSLLDENFYRVFADRLHENGMIYTTIATWGRGDILDQTYHYGDFFRMMRCFDVTGNEDPQSTEPGKRCFIDAKLSSSVTHAYGKRRTAVCGYWASGWGATQAQNVAWTNENYAYGMNLYNRHGGLYSTLGGWYEWVPPAVHFRQPYWHYWRQFTDYVKRLSYVLSQGRHRADVALLYPLTTVHAQWSGGRSFGEPAEETAKAALDLAKGIYRSGIDVDVIDEPSLERARISDGRLHVGDAEFQAIVLPPMTTMPTPALERIHEFYAKGGAVFALGRLPSASREEGRNDPKVRQLVNSIFGVTADDEPLNVVSQTNDAGGQALFVPRGIDNVSHLIPQAIVQDVVASVRDVFHTHRQVGETDVYFLFNATQERRGVLLSFRTTGEPEVWDAWTGQSRPVHRFVREDARTRVRLTMGPCEGMILVFTADSDRPAVVQDSLQAITEVAPRHGDVRVGGLCAEGGRQRVRVAWQGREYEAAADVDGPPCAMSLDGLWRFRLEPTLDNRWGDFRYPASDEIVGAETRCFRYAEEGVTPGTDLTWHEAEYDDSGWQTVKYTYGPYWWKLGPFEGDQVPLGLLRDAEGGAIEPDTVYRVSGKPFAWEPYEFSQQFGRDDPALHHEWGGLRGVPDAFLVFGETGNERDMVSCLLTYVRADAPGDWLLDVGGDAAFPRQAWVNGVKVLTAAGSSADGAANVRLNQGLNSVFLRIVQPEGKRLETHAVFLRSKGVKDNVDARVPLLRWFREPPGLVLDISPDRANRVGWYRFLAPPGVSSMRLGLRARNVQAWVDGIHAAVHDGTISFATPAKETTQIALRVEHEAGCYAGAAFINPVRFDCVEGLIPLGDWSRHGLAMYSGAAVYTQTVHLDKRHLDAHVLLDLGNVRVVAEVAVNGSPAGIRMTEPFTLDITSLVREGDNEIRIRVVNTLANHMSSYPTRFVYEGQTVSGLLGPVQIRFLRRTALVAGRVRP